MRDERFYQSTFSLPFQRQLWEPALRGTTTLYPLARRDPIFTPLFTSFFSTVLGFSATAATIAGGITAAIATTAITMGLQMLMAPTPPKPEDGRVPKAQAIPHRVWGVGRNRTAGAFMLWESKGRRLFSVQALRGHKIKSVNRYWLHDDEVELDANGYVIGLGTRYGGQRVQIFSRLGAVPETAYSGIVSYLGASGLWTNTHRGDGQASVAMICINSDAEKQQKRFPFGAPALSVETDDAVVWDPRDLAQDPDDPSTWQWSRNSALIMIWHQCFNEFGHRRDYRRAILPTLDMWIEEANICDEDVARAGGGTEKRYECNGFDTTENDPKVATNAILASCDGWLCERGDGALLFTVGKFRESRVTTLRDRDIAGYGKKNDVLFEDEINRLVPKFTYPATGYTTTDTDFFEDTDAQLLSGRVLSQEGVYQWVHQWRQARRLAIRDWRRLQEKVSGSLTLRLSGINSVYSRWVRLETPLAAPGLNGMLIENRKSVLSLLQGGFQMDFVRHPENIDAWTPATDEGRQPPVPAKPNAEDILTPVINTVQSVAKGGSVYIRIKIEDPEDDSLIPVVYYRVSDSGSGVPGPWVEQQFKKVSPVSGYITLTTQTVPVDENIDVEVAFKASDGDIGNRSPTETVFAAANPTPPPSVTITSVITGVPGEVTINIKAPNSSIYAGAKFRTNTVNDKTTATYHGPVEAGVANGDYSKTITLSTGTHYGWVSSVNSSGIEQSDANWVATGAFTVI